MEVSSNVFIFFTLLIQLLFQLSQSSATATVVVFDGVSVWRNPTVQIGDTVIFQQKYQHKLYIFKNQKAFSVCNFTQATLLSKPNSTSYNWHPSRTGFFYFSFNNGSNSDCLDGQKLAIKVSLLTPVSPPPESEPDDHQPPNSAAAPPPQVSGGGGGGSVSSSPAFPWPFRPKETASSPSPAPTSSMFPATSPMVPDKSGYPFINSNPAVPLPTGEVDSATIRPFPISGSSVKQMVRVVAVERGLICGILLMLLSL